MNRWSYFCQLISGWTFILLIISSCADNTKQPSDNQLPTFMEEESIDDSSPIKMTDGSNSDMHANWIIGSWTDNYSPNPVFIFDSTFLRYPDTDEMYSYQVDSTVIRIDLGGEEGTLLGEIDMPSDSVLVLIFENEMAIFYKAD